MIKKQHGFTMVELLITMVIFVLTIAAASNIFVGVLTQYKQQSKITETNIEGMIGLELLKNDIEKAGSGLPRLVGNIAYNEFAGGAYNDAPNDPPRAIVFDEHAGGNDSDVLVIKATNIATNNNASGKFTYMTRNGVGALSMKTWIDAQGNPAPDENLVNGDSVIVLRPKRDQDMMIFMGNTIFNNDPNNAVWNGLRPDQNEETRLIYGIDSNGNYRMPFNRADYYIVTGVGVAPAQCAPGMGVLVKATINHNGGGRTVLPIMDCVADMQIVVGRSTHGGNVDSWLVSWPGLDASDIRTQVKEVRVYILAHEGQRDTTYVFPNPNITITDPDAGDLKIINLGALVGATWNQYKWKVYTISAKIKITK